VRGRLPVRSAEGWQRVQLSAGQRRRRATRRKRARIFERDGHRCALCRGAARLTIHHKRPIAYGGTNDDANLLTLCQPCNHAIDVEFQRRAWLVLWLAAVPRAGGSRRYR
jgi:5-methylcytosine-specific restriction endonuclease McrA